MELIYENNDLLCGGNVAKSDFYQDCHIGYLELEFRFVDKYNKFYYTS